MSGWARLLWIMAALLLGGCVMAAEAPAPELTATAPPPLAATPFPTATLSLSARPLDDGSAVDPDILPTLPSYYTVQEEDTMHSVAARYGLTAAELAALNALPAAAPLLPGRQLIVPTAAARATPTATPAAVITYTIQAGDTLSAIAVQFNVSVETLQTANAITRTSEIFAGQTLVIPGGEEGD